MAAVVAATALAACGGSSSDSSSDGSSDPGSATYDPATTTLQKAGLEACSQGQEDVPPTLSALPGLGITRAFYVAKDCKGLKVTPNAMIVFQFTNVDDFNSGTQSIKSALPKASVSALPARHRVDRPGQGREPRRRGERAPSEHGRDHDLGVAGAGPIASAREG